MEKLLQAFENKEPEIVFEWHDSETSARGWAVINTLRGGAAGGGTRMRPGLDKREVVSLAKTMEIKFSVAGPAIGGAKSGIDFDPRDPRKAEVLKRWYKALRPLLKNYYGTGGDLNVDEIHEVIPMTASLGIEHPQEGVVQGHYGGDSQSQRIQQLQQGVTLPVEDATLAPDNRFTVSDMITGYGVYYAVKHYYSRRGQSLAGKRVLVQGWGNVAAAAGYYFAQDGAKITGILDRELGLVAPEGLTFEEVKTLFLDKNGNQLKSERAIPAAEAQRQLWTQGCEVFVPAAASRLVQQYQMDQLIEGGLEVVSCGANVPFADNEIFFGPIARSVDSRVALIPDFIANCGMARVFAYLMQTGITLTDTAIFADVANIIGQAIDAVMERNENAANFSHTAYGIALEKLMPAQA